MESVTMSDWAQNAEANKALAVQHAVDARFPPPSDVASLCYGHVAGTTKLVPVDRDKLRKEKEKKKREVERLKKQTQHTRDIRKFLGYNNNE